MDYLDIPAYIDLIDRVEGVVSTFINADWSGAYRAHGLDGILAEIVACLTSNNVVVMRVSRFSSWSGIQIERLLYRHGVKLWDRRLSGDELCFAVKRRQAVWAEYLLLRAGVPVTSPLVEPRNRFYTAGYPPGSEPPRSA